MTYKKNITISASNSIKQKTCSKNSNNFCLIYREIHYLSKQLETITDPKRRIDFNRELYFLSRRILAKKRQINELQELHAIVRKNGIKDDEQRVDTKPDSRAKREIKSNGIKCVNNESIPKWF